MKYPQFTGDLEQFAQFFMDDERNLLPFCKFIIFNYYLLDLILCSFGNPLFSSCKIGMGKTQSSQYAFHVLRRSYSGFSTYKKTFNFHLTYNLNITQQNLRIEIQKVADFLEKPLTEDELTKLEQHLQLDNFKGNVMVNQEMGKFTGLMNMDAGINFIRKGIHLV